MMKLPKLTQKFLDKLQLNWSVIIERGKGDMLLIQSEVTDVQEWKGCHIISAPVDYLKNPNYYRVDWAHELCHALLAERIDPIFGGSAVVGEIDPKERQRRAQVLFFARVHDDLLVNDVRDKVLGRDLTIEDCQSFQQALIFLVKQAEENSQAKKCLVDPTFPWQIALNIAEDERHHLGLGMEKVLELFDNNSQRYIKKIVGIYRQLPLFSWNKEKILAEFERSVQGIAQEVLEANFFPKMINLPSFPGRKVWSVE